MKQSSMFYFIVVLLHTFNTKYEDLKANAVSDTLN